jgi:hypothetical protein
MPALFAYLIAVGLLLGGGYGALSWLAAPEPVEVAAKTKQPPASTQPSAPTKAAVISEPGSEGRPAPEANRSQAIASAIAANEVRSRSTEPEARTAREQSVSDLRPSPDQQIDSGPAVTEIRESPRQREPVLEAKAENKAENKVEIDGANKQSVQAAPAVNTAAPAAPQAKRPHQRQASRPPEKRRLVLMRLRTIEFADGRRLTQLIPLHDEPRAMAFGPDD